MAIPRGQVHGCYRGAPSTDDPFGPCMEKRRPREAEHQRQTPAMSQAQKRRLSGVAGCPGAARPLRGPRRTRGRNSVLGTRPAGNTVDRTFVGAPIGRARLRHRARLSRGFGTRTSRSHRVVAGAPPATENDGDDEPVSARFSASRATTMARNSHRLLNRC